jgi:oligopeptide/dipeptide ABC transporter ATP-binding protein
MTESEIILETVSLRREFVTDSPFFGAPTFVHAVDGVNLQIRRGETFAIVGESGCGKSTLARLLVRLIDPSAGSVIYKGQDISRTGSADLRALRRDLQFIFQDPFSSLNPQMTVGALVEEPLKTHKLGTPKERKAKVAEMLVRVGLSPQHADRYPHEFSGGQRQRIGIARALVSEPTVLVGDEPVSALDVSIQAQVVNILQDLKDAFGLTLIIIAHDLAVIRHMADRVAVMYLGEIVEIAEADALFDAPQHPYTEALAAAIPLPQVGARKLLSRLDGDPPNPINPPSGCRFHPRCAYAIPRCTEDRPILQPVGDGREVACHRPTELNLNGLANTKNQRSAASQLRFDLYRQARSGQETTTTKV